ncbi:MAG: hypothetical protein QOJ00_2797 [Actinomycetota bacterium]|jgi:undecaprenyl-diphosphatase
MKLATKGVEFALIRKAMPKSPVWAKRILPMTSTAAEGGSLWFVIAGVMAALGGKRGRRGAVEGLLAAAGASGVANAGLKRAIGRHRPSTGVGRFLVREAGRRPHSPSMPSSHAAVAAAFATGAGMAMPSAAAPLGAAAGLVGWSRVSNGRHYTSDVLVGLALGCAIGVVVHTVVGRLRPAARQAETAADDTAKTAAGAPTTNGQNGVRPHTDAASRSNAS